MPDFGNLRVSDTFCFVNICVLLVNFVLCLIYVFIILCNIACKQKNI